jgi:hypothetical protein
MYKYLMSQPPTVCPSCGESIPEVALQLSQPGRLCPLCRAPFSSRWPKSDKAPFVFLFFVAALIFAVAAVAIVQITAEIIPRDKSGLVCAAVPGLIAVICLFLGIWQMCRRPRKMALATHRSAATSAIVTAVSLQPPWYLSKDRAEALVREMAEKHGVKGILRRLGNIREDHLANATSRFVHGMQDDETPLALVDTSFLRNGKAGLLLTNRGLYSSSSTQPVWLSFITKVSFAEPGFWDVLEVCIFALTILGVFAALTRLKRLRCRLFVNGEIAYIGDRLNWEFWCELLPALGAAARAERLAYSNQSGDPAERESPGRAFLLKPWEPIVLETHHDRGDGPALEKQYHENPDWTEIEECIRKLDGHARPGARVWAGESEQAPALDIVGGAGRYALRENAGGWVYYDSSQGDEEVEVVRSSPGYRCQAFYVCTDLARVLAITAHFCRTGAFE